MLSFIFQAMLHVKDGKVYANSHDVAVYFDEEHKDVLESIRSTMRLLTAENSAAWFRPTSYKQKAGFGERSYAALI